MEKYKNKLWKDLNSDIERAEFIECGRAWETGIIAKALENDLAKAYRTCALEEAESGDRQLTIPDVSQRSELLAFMNFLFENWQPRKHLTAEMLVDAYLKANCG